MQSWPAINVAVYVTECIIIILCNFDFFCFDTLIVALKKQFPQYFGNSGCILMKLSLIHKLQEFEI